MTISVGYTFLSHAHHQLLIATVRDFKQMLVMQVVLLHVNCHFGSSTVYYTLFQYRK